MILTRNMKIREQAGGAELLFGDQEIKYSDGWTKGIKVLHGHPYLEKLDGNPNTLKEAKSEEAREKVRNLPFDYIIFDTPSSVGPRHFSSLFWSDLVLIPVEAVALSMAGLKSMVKNIQSIKTINHGLEIRLVINRFLQTSSQQNRTRAELEEIFGSSIIAELSARTHVADAVFEPVWRYSKARDEDLKKAWQSFTNRVLKLIV
jgi:chromosome partitioning protein